MEFTPRIRDILLFLLDKNKAVTELEIADYIGVSRRTIQREFEYIDHSIGMFHLKLLRKKQEGVWLEGSFQDKESLFKKLNQIRNITVIDKDKRRKYLLFELLRSKTPKKLFYYSEMFGVSEATISGDLDALENWLTQNQLQMVKRAGFGVVVTGNEKCYRLALHRFVNENVTDKELMELLNENQTIFLDQMEGRMDHGIVYELFDGKIFTKVRKIFLELQESRLKKMTDTSLLSLLFHLVIAVERILKGELMEENQDLLEEFEMDYDYDLAEKIIHKIEKEFEIEIPAVEMVYILLNIKGARLQYLDTEKKNAQDELGMEKILDLIERMVDAYAPDAKVAYEIKCDEEFLQGMIVHLESSIVRIQNELDIYNPLLLEIKQEYPVIFKHCVGAAKVLEEQIGHPVTEEEIGYLAMHFGATIERQKSRKYVTRNVEIGVVCASGFGIARLMVTKLKNSLRSNVTLKTFGRDEINPYIIGKVDFFVSSLNLDDLGVDYVMVSPLISAGDLQKVQLKLDVYASIPKKSSDQDFAKQLEEIHYITEQIKLLIRKYRTFSIDRYASMEEVLDYFVHIVTETKRSGELLKQDLLLREEVMSQIFPEMEFALFHCKSRAIKENGFYCCIPKGGAVFEAKEWKQIKAVVFLLMPDDENRKINSEILGYISGSFVDKEDFLPSIFDGEEEATRHYLEKILRLFFNECIGRY